MLLLLNYSYVQYYPESFKLAQRNFEILCKNCKYLIECETQARSLKLLGISKIFNLMMFGRLLWSLQDGGQKLSLRTSHLIVMIEMQFKRL